MKKINRKNVLIMESQHYGPEPKWEKDEAWDELKFLKAINWVNNFGTNAEYKKYVLEYVKRAATPGADHLPDLEEREFSHSYTSCGAYAWAMNRGLVIEHVGMMEHFSNQLQRLILKSKWKKTLKDDSKDDSNVISPFDATNARVNEYMGQLEVEIDNLITSHNFKYEFDCRDWITVNEIKPLIAKKISDLLQPRADEIHLARSGKDEDMKEGYSIYNANELKLYEGFLLNIIGSLRFEHQVKKKRKRVISLDKQVSKLKMATEDTEYKIIGLHPTKLIGAKELWYWKIDKREVGVLISSEPGGFTVKGSTILGISESESKRKKVRKPKEFFAAIKGTSSKKKLQKQFDSLTTREGPTSGRTSDHMIIINIFN